MAQSSDRILVINPNSTDAVTRGIDAAMAPLRMSGGPAIECVTLKEGPPGIESQAHVEQVVGPIGEMVRQRDNDCSAFVIACYSDPGLHAAREITTKPVLGIAECGILTALTLGQRFGVISILKKSIPRHLRYVGQMGLADRMAGDRAIGLGVVDLADEARTFIRMAEAPPNCATKTAPTCWSWAAPAWPATATACSAMSACPSSSRARPPSPWRSAAPASPGRPEASAYSRRNSYSKFCLSRQSASVSLTRWQVRLLGGPVHCAEERLQATAGWVVPSVPSLPKRAVIGAVQVMVPVPGQLAVD